MARYRADIDVIADLKCELDGKAVSVRSMGRQTIVEIPDLAAGLRLIRLGSPRGFFRSLHDLKRLLDAASHVLELRIQGKTVGLVGYLEGSRVWRIFGLPVLTLKPLAIVIEAARRLHSSR